MKEIPIPPVTPRALILCTDERLSRLLEAELAYLGVAARCINTLPVTAEKVNLLVADGDETPVFDCEAFAHTCGCSLLIFGRGEITLPAERGVFLRRPFGLDRLEAVVRGLLSTNHPCLWEAIPPQPASMFSVESEAASPLLTVEEGCVTAEGKPIPMTPAESAILECLYARRGETVTREELAALLGGGGNSVEVYVCKLRTKLEKPLGRRLIHTVRGVGYRMDV